MDLYFVCQKEKKNNNSASPLKFFQKSTMVFECQKSPYKKEV